MAKVITLPSLLPKDHLVLRSSSHVETLCMALLKNYGITTFGHTRIYNDGSRFVLCNQANWVEYAYNKGYVYLTRLNRLPSCYQSGYYLWDAWDPNHPGHQLVGNDAAENFNIGRGITILEKSKDWVDKYEFASTPNNYEINNFYINNLNLLDNFINYFKNTAGNLIEEAAKCRGIVPTFNAIDMHNDYPDTRMKKNFVNSQKNKYIQKLPHIFYPILTKREIECAYWLIKGKTVPEISIILGISPRTVEKFILNLKEKFGCYTLFQLGQKIAAVGLDKLLE